MAENLSLFFDDIYSALRGFVSFAGGSKVVGPLVFPKKGEKAAAWLDDCLNADRAAKLDPEELLHMLKLARERGFDGVMQYIGSEADYEVTRREPRDELAALYSQFVESAKSLSRLQERIERVESRAKGSRACR
jgi:hypothetical protein